MGFLIKSLAFSFFWHVILTRKARQIAVQVLTNDKDLNCHVRSYEKKNPKQLACLVDSMDLERC